MAACASPLRLLGVGLMSGTLGGQTVLSVTEGIERASFGHSLLSKATPHLLRMQTLRRCLDKYSSTRAPLGHDPGTMPPDADIAVELFLHEEKIKTPYERNVAFLPCLFSRWYDSDCVPGIGSKVFTDNPLSDDEIQAALERSLSGGPNVHQVATFTRPYILVVHGNDQYVVVYPHAEEIGPGHPHRQRVEQHFAERGLNHLTESAPIDWGKLHG